MPTLHAKTPEHFLVDENGKPEAVVLSLAQYSKLMRHIEDLEDAAFLKRAIQTSRGTLSHAKLLERLKRRRLL